MSERGPKGLGSHRIVMRKDGSLALRMKVTVNGVDHVKTIDAPPKRKIVEARTAFAAEVHSGAFTKAKLERQKLSEQPTLAEWSAVFLKHYVTQDLDRAATLTAYTNVLRLYVLPTLGKSKLTDIAGPDIRALLHGLYDHGHGKSINTVQLTHSVVRLCFEAACEEKLLVTSPVPKFSKLRLGDAESPANIAKRHALSAEHVELLLGESAHDPELHLFAALLFSCGLRPGEANGLLWGDIDLRAGRIHVRRAAKKVYGQPGEGARIWLGKPKRPASIRDIAIGPALAAMILRERNRQDEALRLLSGRDEKVRDMRSLVAADMCVFCEDFGTEDGRRRPLSPSAFYGRVKSAADRAGIPDVSGHWGRHTAISHALAGGAPLADVAKRAGHANAAVTAAIYAHAVGEGEQKAAAIGDSLLSPSKGAKGEKRDGSQ